MRRAGLLNPALIALTARAGHGDVIVLADAGLRVPRGAERIDLELTPGIPSMLQVLDAVLPDLVVEGAIVAEEMSSWNPELKGEVLGRLAITPQQVPHAEFAEQMASSALAYVKTGECSAYASVALICGVSYYDEAVAHHSEIERRSADAAARERVAMQ